VIDGGVAIHGNNLDRRDAIDLWELDSLEIGVLKDAKILHIEVPMNPLLNLYFTL
jgi:hypothetical protein